MNSPNNSINFSLSHYTKIAGFLYLIIIVLGIFTEIYVRDGLIVYGNPALTAENILGASTLWRLAASAGIVMLVSAVIFAYIFYVLFKHVNNNIALLAVFFNLVSISIEAMIKLNLFEALSLLENSHSLIGLETIERQTLAYHSILMHSSGYNISLVFFGLNCLFWGYLIYKSSFFPKSIGVLLVICCFSYLINSFSWLINPNFAKQLYPIILIPSFIAELATCLWLLFKGVDEKKWNEEFSRIL
jgi:hypothetical protein